VIPTRTRLTPTGGCEEVGKKKTKKPFTREGPKMYFSSSLVSSKRFSGCSVRRIFELFFLSFLKNAQKKSLGTSPPAAPKEASCIHALGVVFLSLDSLCKTVFYFIFINLCIGELDSAKDESGVGLTSMNIQTEAEAAQPSSKSESQKSSKSKKVCWFLRIHLSFEIFASSGFWLDY